MSAYGGNRLRKKASNLEYGDEWLITYTDAITLLLAFFVLILATAEIDQRKFEQSMQGIAKGLLKKEETTLPLKDVKEQLETIFIEHQLEDHVQVEFNKRGITVEFASNSFYLSGSADIRPEAIYTLEAIAKALLGISLSSYMIEVEGHTDDVPISTIRYPSNWELSVNRATNIVKFLQEHGIRADFLKAAGYGDSRPKLPNLDEYGEAIPENRAENRRVVIYVHRD